MWPSLLGMRRSADLTRTSCLRESSQRSRINETLIACGLAKNGAWDIPSTAFISRPSTNDDKSNHDYRLHYIGSVATIQYGSTADADGM